MPNTTKRGLAVVTLGYFVSRVAFHLLGIRFLGMENINVYLQFIDPPLLEHDLLRSLYYTSFPPLYNLIVGVMLKLFGESAPAFAILHLFIGWGIALILFRLMVDLGIGARLAITATLLFMVLPPMILYENWLFYSYFETLFFLLAVWSFHRFVQKAEWPWGLLLFSTCTALALLNARMMFFVIIIFTLLAWVWRRDLSTKKLRVTLCSASPLLLVALVMLKNALVFGTFTLDPHFGFHMGNGFVYAAWGDPETHAVCVKDYPMLLTAPTDFPPAAKVGLEPIPKTGIALLDDPLRSKGKQNYNNLYYLEVSKLYSEELGNFISAHPRLYANFVGWAFLNYWRPSSHYTFFPRDNLQVLGVYDTAYSQAYPGLWFLYGTALSFAVAMGWRSRWRDPIAITLLFMVATVGYNLLAVFVTLGENDRYKFTIEPLLWVLVVYLVQCLLNAIRQRKQPALETA